MKSERKSLLLDVLLIAFAAGLFLRSFLAAGFITSHEHGRHFERLFEYNVAVRDGHFPVRWFPDFALRYGYPFPNFYAPLFYYAAEVWLLLGASYLFAVKATVALSVLLGAYGMYALGRVLWNRQAALLAAIAFSFIPYRIGDLYVRGDLAEFLAMSLLPLLFWQRLKVYTAQQVSPAIRSSVVHAAIICSHNISALLATALLLIVDAVFVVRRGGALVRRLAVAYLIAFSLSAFFWMPALLEKKYVTIENVVAAKYAVDFRANFPSLRELVDPRWGYGAFRDNAAPPMSVQLGVAPLILWLLGIILFLALRGKNRDKAWLFIALSSLAVCSIFMTTRLSKPLWEILPLLRFAQFPWRLHIITVPLLALLAAAPVYIVSRHRPRLLVPLIAASLVLFMAFGIAYCRRGSTLAIREGSFSREAFSTQLITSALQNEYLPRAVSLLPKSSKYARRLVSADDERIILPSEDRTQRVVFSVSVMSAKSFFFGQFYFPGWVCLLDGNLVSSYELTRSGMMRIAVPQGDHRIEFRFTNTPLRTFANTLSLAALVALMVILALFLIRRGAGTSLAVRDEHNATASHE